MPGDKRNPSDLTLRNLRALKKTLARLERRVAELEAVGRSTRGKRAGRIERDVLNNEITGP